VDVLVGGGGDVAVLVGAGIVLVLVGGGGDVGVLVAAPGTGVFVEVRMPRTVAVRVAVGIDVIVRVPVRVGVEVGGAGVSVEVGSGVSLGWGVGVSLGTGVDVGAVVGTRVGVGVGTGSVARTLALPPQLAAETAIRITPQSRAARCLLIAYRRRSR